MVEKQRLHAVGKTLACEDQLVKLLNDRHINMVRFTVSSRVVIAGAEKIRIKDARHAIFPQQDQRVRQRFKPGFDRCFKRLQRLGVMVRDEGDRMKRIGFYQGAGEDLAHVVIPALT